MKHLKTHSGETSKLRLSTHWISRKKDWGHLYGVMQLSQQQSWNFGFEVGNDNDNDNGNGNDNDNGNDNRGEITTSISLKPLELFTTSSEIRAAIKG